MRGVLLGIALGLLIVVLCGIAAPLVGLEAPLW